MNNIYETFYKHTFKQDVSKEIDLSESGIKSLEVKWKDIFRNQAETLKYTEETLDNTAKLVEDQIKIFDSKLSRVVEKVKGALLSERSTSGAIYTTTIPIQQQNTTKNNTATITEGIVYGVPLSSIKAVNTTPIKLKHISLSDNASLNLGKDYEDSLINFKVVPKDQEVKSFDIIIRTANLIKTTSNLVFDLTSYAPIEVFKNGSLYLTKSLYKVITVPVDTEDESVTIRVYPHIEKTKGYKFNSIGFTELLYNEEVTYETKENDVLKTLSHIVVDTCDNSNTSEINYEISINGNEYESFSPVAKRKALEKQSIITLDKDSSLNLVEALPKKESNSLYKLYIPDSVSLLSKFQHTFYIVPKDKNLKRVYVKSNRDIELNSFAISDKELILNNHTKLDGNFTLRKGIHYLQSESLLNINYLETLLGVDSIFSSKQDRNVYTDEEGTYLALSIQDILEGSKFFLPSKKKKIFVEKLKIRATLKSHDGRTVPFISRILIRGV